MKKFTYLEMFILKNLRDSLNDSFAQAIKQFPINSEPYLATQQRLTISPTEQALSKIQFASAPVVVTDFVEKRRRETVEELVRDFYSRFSDVDETEMWVTVTMLSVEGLVELEGSRGIVHISKAGLEALRDWKMTD